jgi:hypothetical protein
MVFDDHVVAAAIPDHLLHCSTTLDIKRASYCPKEKRRAGFLGDPGPCPKVDEEVPSPA